MHLSWQKPHGVLFKESDITHILMILTMREKQSGYLSGGHIDYEDHVEWFGGGIEFFSHEEGDCYAQLALNKESTVLCVQEVQGDASILEVLLPEAGLVPVE